MEHNMHTNLHWGYSSATAHSAPQTHWVPPPPSHSLKRALSESDCEELFSEESSEKQISPSESGGVHNMSRKKRRGVIEKKRRDRINSSLSELKRLVPTAYEKQGSAKLEKAEILQLTVEHLKNLNAKGMDSLNFDAQRFAMDYHIIGFRECAAEVARYLVTIEGMDIQDPLRLRLMSHLQYFVQQRELSAKPCAGTNTWVPPANTTPNMYQSNCSVAAYQTYPAATNSYVPNLPVHPYPTLSVSPNSSHMHQQTHQHHVHQQISNNQRQNIPPSVTSTNDSIAHLNQQTSAPQTNPTHTHTHTQPAQVQISRAENTHQIRSPTLTHQPLTTHAAHQHHYTPQATDHHAQELNQSTSTYIELTSRQTGHVQSSHRNTTPEVSSTGVTYASENDYPDSSAGQAYNPNSNLQYVNVNGSKPYRPWGAEMAY